MADPRAPFLGGSSPRLEVAGCFFLTTQTATANRREQGPGPVLPPPFPRLRGSVQVAIDIEQKRPDSGQGDRAIIATPTKLHHLTRHTPRGHAPQAPETLGFYEQQYAERLEG